MQRSLAVGIALALGAACGRGGEKTAPPAVHSPDGSGTAPGSAGSSGTTMSAKSTASVSVAASVTASKPGRPPLQRLTVELTIDNPGDAPRWVTIAKQVPRNPDLGADAGVDALELRGQGNAVLGVFRGSGSVYALRVGGHAKVTITNLEVGWWHRSPDETKVPDLDVSVADDLTIGGAPATDWFGLDPLVPNGARIDAGAAGKDAHSIDGEATIALTGATPQAAALALP
ncbi:MAG TPA: hypothetical protein VHE35_03120 [Kofleriaceae bacterium]|nr:hypothetical protein [Kofleriaceae bacterium]